MPTPIPPIPPSEITPQSTYLNRRSFLAAAAAAGPSERSP